MNRLGRLERKQNIINEHSFLIRHCSLLKHTFLKRTVICTVCHVTIAAAHQLHRGTGLLIYILDLGNLATRMVKQGLQYTWRIYCYDCNFLLITCCYMKRLSGHVNNGKSDSLKLQSPYSQLLCETYWVPQLRSLTLPHYLTFEWSLTTRSKIPFAGFFEFFVRTTTWNANSGIRWV
jgi:hypothetical protein